MAEKLADWDQVERLRKEELERIDRKERRVFIVTICGFVLMSIIAGGGLTLGFDALATQHRSSDKATARITSLQATVKEQSGQIAFQAVEIGKLRDQTEALSEQVRQLGGKPIVVVNEQPTSSTQPRPSPSPSPSTTAPPQPTTTTTTRPACAVAAGGVCVRGGGHR